MTYNIFDRTAPAMPKPAKVTEIVKLLLSQASKDMHEPLVPMLFPVLGAHLTADEPHISLPTSRNLTADEP